MWHEFSIISDIFLEFLQNFCKNRSLGATSSATRGAVTVCDSELENRGQRRGESRVQGPRTGDIGGKPDFELGTILPALDIQLTVYGVDLVMNTNLKAL